MPIDKMYSDPMLSTFRTMMTEVEEKGYSNDDVNVMRDVLAKMEKYAIDMDDFTTFSATLTTENLFGQFSDHYGRVLALAAKEKYSSNGSYDDQADKQLLSLSLDALRVAIKSLNDSKEDTRKLMGENGKDVDVLFKQQSIIDSIQKLIDLGESGINYPTYLRIQTEQNLDKAMEGSAVLRDGLVYSYDLGRAIPLNPHYPEKLKRQLEMFDRMADASAFKTPDPLKFTLACDKIAWELEPDYIKWDKISNSFDSIFDKLFYWALAHTSFAPTIDPWKGAKNPMLAVEQDKDCDPGILKVKVEIMQRNFGISFYDIFSHEIFINLVKTHFMWYSQEMMSFMVNQVYPQCKPFQYLAKEQINKMEDIWMNNKLINPDVHKPMEIFARMFNQYFGEGEYEKRFPTKEKVKTNAIPWNLDTFLVKPQ